MNKALSKTRNEKIALLNSIVSGKVSLSELVQEDNIWVVNVVGMNSNHVINLTKGTNEHRTDDELTAWQNAEASKTSKTISHDKI